MTGMLRSCLSFLTPRGYRRLQPLVLINGLAEQPESWYCNRDFWQRYFDVQAPGFLVYDGPVIQRRIEDGLPITVDFLTEQLELYLDSFVQKPPYHLVASSLGCQVAVEYTIRNPDKVNRIVLLCPSGMGGEERLPVVDGVRHNDYQGMVGSVFYQPRNANLGLIRHYERQFSSKPWKKAVLRTVRGTSAHSVRDKLPLIQQPAMVICGREDRITDPEQAYSAVKDLPNFRYKLLPRCGHAPQIERYFIVNRMVRDFLCSTAPQPLALPAVMIPANASYA